MDTIFGDRTMLFLALLFALSLIVSTVVSLWLRRESWFWSAALVPPAVALAYYYLVVYLDPNIPENDVPADLLTALFRPALAWLFLVVSTNILSQLVIAWRGRRRE